MKKLLTGTAVKIILIAAIVGGTSWYLFHGVKRVAKVQAVIRGKAVDAIPGTLTVEAKTIVDVSADLTGMVQVSKIDFGQVVREGDIILQLDDELIQIDIEKRNNELNSTRKRLELPSPLAYTLKNMEEDLKDSKRKYREGNMSEFLLTRQEREYEQAKDNLIREDITNRESIKGKELDLKRLERELRKATVYAPVNGTIADIFSFPGELVRSGAVVCQIISDELRIEGKISEENFAGIKAGQHALIRFLAYGNEMFNGTVKQVLPTADPVTQQYSIFLDVDMPREKLLPGLTGELSIVKGERENSLIIPRRALLGRYVLAVKDGIVRLLPVQTGFLGMQKAEILSGIEEGEYVIVEKLDQFQDGNEVRIEVVE